MNFDDNDYKNLKAEMTIIYRQRGSDWSPSKEDLDNIEQYAFVGILEPKTIATLLHVEYKEFIAATFIDNRVLSAVELGKARALLSVNTTLMGISTGVIDPASVDFRALKFLCTSRFGYVENAVIAQETKKTTKKRNRLEREKLELARKMHSDRVDIETTKMAMALNSEELEALNKK
jgi:hypothetical protein